MIPTDPKTTKAQFKKAQLYISIFLFSVGSLPIIGHFLEIYHLHVYAFCIFAAIGVLGLFALRDSLGFDQNSIVERYIIRMQDKSKK